MSGLVWAFIAIVVACAIIAFWRIVIHDPKVMSIRWGVFFERSLCEDEEEDDRTEQERQERLERKTYQ